jgi:CubicO group peptidase (beta-lactamase class C family)
MSATIVSARLAHAAIVPEAEAMMIRTGRRIVILAAASAVLSLGASVSAAETAAHYSGLTPDVFLKSWLVLGPIPMASGTQAPDDEAQKKAFDADLLAACGGEARVRFAPPPICSISGQDYRFTLVQAEGDVLDLAKAIGRKDYTIAYAMAEVDLPAAATVLAGLGSDDGITVWLNGKVVHRNWVQRAVSQDQDLVTLALHPGKNQLLLKVQNRAGDWGFALRPLGTKQLEERLWVAAKDGDLDLIPLILTSGQGVQVNATPRAGLTPWQIAKTYGRTDAADLLAGRGADTKAPMPRPEAIVDAMFTALTPGRSPGVAVLAMRDGAVLLERGYGYASPEHGVKATPETKFRIGSITKQFTAAAILRLQEQGKLSVSDPLSKFMPEYPRGNEITLHHLLTHTSGLHSYTDKPDFLQTVTVPIKSEDLIQSFKNDPPDFAPGGKFAYCNSGYFLLGAIVEKVSGQSYADFLRTQFFEPLGMKATGVHTYDAILENEATGYAQEGNVLKKALNWDMSRAGGAGALYSTVGDLARWNEALFNGKVLNEVSLKAAFTPVKVGPPSQPADEGYGYGWAVGKFRGLREVQHGGGLQGFVSQLSRYPGEHFTVVVLVNAEPPPPGLAPSDLARDIAQIFLAEKMESRPTPKAIALSPEALDQVIGRYDYQGPVMTVTRDGDRLYAQLTGQGRFEIFPKSETEFFWKVVDAQVTFVKDVSGRTIKAIHHQGPVTFEAPRLEERATVSVAPVTLDAYVGKYDYGQGEVVMTITREGNRLFAELTGQPKFEIYPMSETEFFWKVVEAKITFVKDASGRVVKGIHEQGGRKLDVPKIE